MRKLLVILVMLLAPLWALADPVPDPPVDPSVEKKEPSSVDSLEESTKEGTIASMAQGLIEFKKYPGTDISGWYSCGEFVPLERQEKEAMRWARTTYNLLEKYNRENGTDISVWGVFAVVLNESGADECAVDFHTRNVLYHLGLLKRPRKHITHSKSDLKKAFASWRWKRWAINASKYQGKQVGVDLGAMQLRRKWKKISSKLLDDTFNLEKSLSTAIPEMIRRSKAYPVGIRKNRRPHPRPWMLWPGQYPSKRATRYDKRITKIARKFLGAPRSEI